MSKKIKQMRKIGFLLIGLTFPLVLGAAEIQPITPQENTETIETTETTEVSEKTEQTEQDVSAILTEEEAAQHICEVFNVGPLYDPNGKRTPYINRLYKEGIYPQLQLDGLTLEQILEITESLKEHAFKTFETPYYEVAPIGILMTGTQIANIQGNELPLYELNQTNYVQLKDLEKIGFKQVKTSNGTKLSLNGQSMSNGTKIVAQQYKDIASANPEKLYIGNTLTYSLVCQKEIFIPLRALNEYFSMAFKEKTHELVLRTSISEQFMAITPNGIENRGSQSIKAEIVNVFWNGKEIVEERVVTPELAPGETYGLNEAFYAVTPGMTHISTLVDKIYEKDQLVLECSYKNFGQHGIEFLKLYSSQKGISIEQYLEKLFPATVLKGTVKYNTSGLVKGEQVEVWRADDGKYYYVRKNNQTIRVPWSSIQMPATPKAGNKNISTQLIETFINSKQIESKTPYLVWTDLYRQQTYVFERQNDQWKLIRTMLCSTGKNKTPTPSGEFQLSAYVPAFGMNKGYMCKNAVQIFGDYLYHSIMFDVKGRYIIGGQGQLGEQASHGCIRLSPENAEWFYKNMPLRTKVIIR